MALIIGTFSGMGFGMYIQKRVVKYYQEETEREIEDRVKEQLRMEALARAKLVPDHWTKGSSDATSASSASSTGNGTPSPK